MNIPDFLRRESRPQETRDEINTELEPVMAALERVNTDIKTIQDRRQLGLVTPGEYTLEIQFLEQYKQTLLDKREKLLARVDKLGSFAAQTVFRQQ